MCLHESVDFYTYVFIFVLELRVIELCNIYMNLLMLDKLWKNDLFFKISVKQYFVKKNKTMGDFQIKKMFKCLEE